MTAATKDRILHAVPDSPAPAILTTDVPDGRELRLSAERETARLAITMPEIIEERDAAIDTAIQRLTKHTMDRRTALTKLAEEMLALGYVNGAADERQAGHNDLAERALAAVYAFEAAEAGALHRAEAAIKAKGGAPVSRPTALKAADQSRLAQAYESHRTRCFTCRRGETYCDTGAAILAAIATTDNGSDLPGYGA